jgi:hypothetical protein
MIAHGVVKVQPSVRPTISCEIDGEHGFIDFLDIQRRLTLLVGVVIA